MTRPKEQHETKKGLTFGENLRVTCAANQVGLENQ